MILSKITKKALLLYYFALNYSIPVIINIHQNLKKIKKNQKIKKKKKKKRKRKKLFN